MAEQIPVGDLRVVIARALWCLQIELSCDKYLDHEEELAIQKRFVSEARDSIKSRYHGQTTLPPHWVPLT